MVYPKAFFQPLKLSAVFLLLAPISVSAFVGERENRIIDKTVKAYGGDKLIQLKSIKFTDDLQHFFKMQSGHSDHGPMSMHFNKYQIEVDLDLVNNSKEFKRVSERIVGNHGAERVTTTHRVLAKGKGYSIDHCLQEYRPINSMSYNNADLGFSQMLDPLIVMKLSKDRAQSKWTDIAYIQGQPHDVLTVNAGTKAEYSVYLNQKTGYLTRMLKKHGAQVRSYDFLDYQHSKGITWAKEMFVSTKDQPVYHTDARQLSFNQQQNIKFKVPAGYQKKQQDKFFDVSKLTIRELAKGVYFIGQDWGYSLFIDAGDYYISAGVWGPENNSNAWQQGLDLLYKTTGIQKPVAQYIVTHHHTDHMSGLSSIVKQGANLVIHPTDISAVNQHLVQPLVDERFVPIAKTSFLADGKVMLFDLPTSHASHNLMVYLPEHQILFSEDIFGSSYQTGFHSPNSWPVLDTYQRLKALDSKLEQLGLEVKQYVSSHHGRVLSQADIDKALTLTCPAKDELVKRLFKD